MYKIKFEVICGGLLLIFTALSACSTKVNGVSPSFTPQLSGPVEITETESPVEISSKTPSMTLSPSVTASTTPSLTPSPTPSPTITSTPSITPTYTELRGKVTAEQLSCRFGPGVMYLFKYSVFRDTVLEIIGRMELSSWILVQAVGGSNPCWVNGDYIEIRGEINAVAPADPHQVLAWSPYYDALTGVSAERDGDVVTVFWNPLILRAGDSSEQVPYVVEAWVCRAGEIVFAPVGAYALAAEVIDEPGCDQPSYARVLGAEKHGYTQWRVVPWPQASQLGTPTP